MALREAWPEFRGMANLSTRWSNDRASTYRATLEQRAVGRRGGWVSVRFSISISETGPSFRRSSSMLGSTLANGGHLQTERSRTAGIVEGIVLGQQ